jgi:hypothetical protein
MLLYLALLFFAIGSWWILSLIKINDNCVFYMIFRKFGTIGLWPGSALSSKVWT